MGLEHTPSPEHARSHAHAEWQCGSCSFVYDEAQGWPSEGIAPGTPWAQVPESWRCPDCSSSKDDFSAL